MADSSEALGRQLELIDQAIENRLTGVGHISATSAAGKSLQYLSLDELYRARREILTQLRQSRGPVVVRPKFTRRPGQ